ncbi:hypothetical protein [Halorientalis pallida]|uniref:Uncharacterized protein n=1 Tax=Halorientalis pallida TaxID=2479928 RepID=A0A498KYI3_9EURY|nr:hypothetical protein [Halorientalis pallida]RXK48002.1 hypothetical protein EAF64_15335 [Halorientalis pallida]
MSAEVYEAGVTELPIDRVRDIYHAERTNWAAIGGPDPEIDPVGGPRRSPTGPTPSATSSSATREPTVASLRRTW